MAAQGSAACWVWCPVDAAKAREFRHPAEVPMNDEAVAKACFLESQRGPRHARIRPATMLQSKGNLALIAEKGTTREVPKFMVLPWYEGLLILEELEQAQGQPGRIPANWWDDELRGLLDKERNKFQTGRLNSILYTEKRLLNVAVTGTCFIDGDDKQWHFRRENVRGDSAANLTGGEDGNSFFRIKDITDYLPPWEAFHHEKCGFYQDFYQVRWEHPFSQVNYGTVENGCSSQTGSTWEPDECLPAHLDSLRLAAKKAWISRRRQQSTGTTPTGPELKRERSDAALPIPAKMAKTRRDGVALDRDLFCARIGHDFAPEGAEKTLGHLRAGWPKQPQDYPTGFAVASPPGFCWSECDCMDDQRPQRPWETRKAWLEDVTRATAAASALQIFSEQAQFVRKRGQVSKMFYFETAQGAFVDQSHAFAAAEFSQHIKVALQTAMQQVPVSALAAEGDNIAVPARAFLLEDVDYEPLRYSLAASGTTPPPEWLRIDPDNGGLTLVRQPNAGELPAPVQVELTHSEGVMALAPCFVVADSSAQPVTFFSTPLFQRFNDLAACNLERGVRTALTEHLSVVYDFNRRACLEVPLGTWLATMCRVMRLLRSAAGTNLSLSAVR